MNTLYFLWTTVRSAFRALGRNSDRQEQREAESYLSDARSFAELECRQRNWMQSH